MPARLKTTLSRARSAAATGLQPPQKRSTRRVMMRQMPLSTVFAPVHPQFRAAFNQTPVGGALSLHLVMVHDLLRIGTALGGEIMHAFTVTTPAYLRLKPNGHMPSSAHAKSNIASNATVPGHTRGFSRIRKTDGLVPLPPTFKARIRHRQVQRLRVCQQNACSRDRLSRIPATARNLKPTMCETTSCRPLPHG